MLKDIEFESYEETEDVKNKKQYKSKKTNGQKRLIAAQIAMYCFCATAVSMVPVLCARPNYDADIKALNNEQNKIYEQFMACEEFSNSFKAMFTKLSNDYANGLITYEEFNEKVDYLNSVKYAQDVLKNSNNSLKAAAEKIEQNKKDRTDEFHSSIAVNLSLAGLGVGSAVTIAATTATMVYALKENAEENRKKKLLTNKPGIVGIKYYDSTTMTIRNTNGKNEENNEETYYDYTETLIPNPIKQKNDEDTLSK